MSLTALPGFRDFYPAELAERTHIFAAWREVARRYAFVEYDGPPLEPLELYTRKSGDEIVGQLYNFQDKGGRDVSLRPEMTPSLARMVAARANALRKPIRWFSVPQLFRYERQQRGRLREHFQLNMDILGEPDVTADAELLAAAIDIMRQLGLTHDDVIARVSDRALLNALLAAAGISEQQLPAAYAALDKLGRDPRSVLEERLTAAGMVEEQRQRLFELGMHGIDLEKAGDTVGLGVEGTKSVERLRRYRDYLDALGVADFFRLDLSIVRGLAYYTGIVFELFDAKGELRAICGGGRYDQLVRSVGSVDLPALGFGMGDVVLGELLRARQLMPAVMPAVEYWVASEDGGDLRDAMRLAAQLRQRGRSVEYALGGQKRSRQLKSAHAAGARVVVMVETGPDGEREVTVRDMVEGSERRLPMDQWLASL